MVTGEEGRPAPIVSVVEFEGGRVEVRLIRAGSVKRRR